MTVTLEQYEQVERQMTMREARIGLAVHAVISVVVWAVLIPVNVFAVPDFPWSAFVVGGMGIGLFFHWFGFRRADADIRRRQRDIEARARTLAHV